MNWKNLKPMLLAVAILTVPVGSLDAQTKHSEKEATSKPKLIAEIESLHTKIESIRIEITKAESNFLLKRELGMSREEKAKLIQKENEIGKRLGQARDKLQEANQKLSRALRNRNNILATLKESGVEFSFSKSFKQQKNEIAVAFRKCQFEMARLKQEEHVDRKKAETQYRNSDLLKQLEAVVELIGLPTSKLAATRRGQALLVELQRRKNDLACARQQLPHAKHERVRTTLEKMIASQEGAIKKLEKVRAELEASND